MIEQTGNSVTAVAAFTASKAGKTGLTVTVDVYRIGAGVLFSALSASELGGGLYYYTLSGTNTGNSDDYLFVFKTTDTTVDYKSAFAMWSVGRAGINHLNADISSRMATFTLPGNFAALVIDVSGNVNSNLAKLLGTSIPAEAVAGNYATNWKKLLDADVVGAIKTVTDKILFDGSNFVKATAQDIASGVVTTIQSGLMLLSSYYNPQTDLSNLLTRLSAARAGYLDNLSGGAVALHSDIAALNQSASRNVILANLGQIERPESGTTTFNIDARFFDKSGNPVDTDSTPTLTATGNVTGSLAGNLSSATHITTGVYRWTYTAHAADNLEQYAFDVAGAISSVAYGIRSYSELVDDVSANFNTSDRTMISAVYNKLPSRSNIAGSASSDGNVVADVQTGVAAIPTNPLLTSDTRLNHLNADISAVLTSSAFSTALSALQSHGDSNWETAVISSLLTSSAFNSAMSALQSHGDDTWSAADVSALLTAAGFATAISSLETFGNTHWSTADVAALLTSAAFTTAITNLQTHGDDNWEGSGSVDLSDVATKEDITDLETFGNIHWLTANGFATAADVPTVDDIVQGILGHTTGGFAPDTVGGKLALLDVSVTLTMVAPFDPDTRELHLVHCDDYTLLGTNILPTWENSLWTTHSLLSAYKVVLVGTSVGGATMFFDLDVMTATKVRLQVTEAETCLLLKGDLFLTDIKVWHTMGDAHPATLVIDQVVRIL